MLGTIRKVADGLISLSAAIGALGLVAETGIILVDVIGRAFGSPLFGSQDLITMTMVILVFGGMALCDRNGGHISVDLLERKFPSAVNRVIDITAALLGALIFGFIAWSVWDSAQLSVMLNLSTNLLGLPKAWFQWALCAFAALTALGMMLRALELIVSGRDIRKEWTQS
ncbi:C4-dicarboxylate ABC transporter substrate-binding protein [Allosediminivita pacifica]|uniref:TRAP transporter small permease protein n=1 Tax=Allosediminivita pacifica TaxID=1267769 RepID=A0A2T6B452_9RHOB|nr:TRAP-type C4-dicarboxylate transport system permease small subunit [Allosediminivita pacifica]GGB01377.1 C4-dicarboxylate ABC transporter substrate-binding protein [Allosediminivita pacifica]